MCPPTLPHAPACVHASVDRRMLMRRQMVSWRVSYEVWTMEENTESSWVESLRVQDVLEVLLIRFGLGEHGSQSVPLIPWFLQELPAYCRPMRSVIVLHVEDPWSHCTRKDPPPNIGSTA